MDPRNYKSKIQIHSQLLKKALSNQNKTKISYTYKSQLKFPLFSSKKNSFLLIKLKSGFSFLIILIDY